MSGTGDRPVSLRRYSAITYHPRLAAHRTR
jgi:hypothetical protein